ncbi:MAG: J domain-containing protein [Limisphaerales bacterium]
MTDHFATLGLDRRPVIDLADLAARFRLAAGASHPDRVHETNPAARQTATNQFAALNAAFNCLRDPKERLEHLLELELETKPREVQRLPADTMELYVELGATCRDVDAFLVEKAAITSPVLLVALMEKGLEWTERLTALRAKIRQQREELLELITKLDVQWQNAPPVGSPDRRPALPLERLEQIHRQLSYTTRWSEQVEERRVRLSL